MTKLNSIRDSFLAQLEAELRGEIENISHYIDRVIGADLPEPETVDETPPVNNVYDEIARERERAHIKHVAAGKSVETRDFYDPEWLPILTEEIGEVARALCDNESVEHLRDELIQVAAMAAAWADSCSRFIDDSKELNV